MKRVIALSAALSLLALTALAQVGPPVGPGGGGGGGGAGTPGGSNGQIQYNNAGAFGGAVVGSGLSLSGGTLSATAAGTVTSIATACGVTGGTITTAGTLQGSITANNVSTAGAYAFLASDCGALVRFTDAVSRAPTLNVALFAAGNFINLKNDGTGTQTITPSAGTINGAATYALVPGAGVTIAYDLTNTNWVVSQTAMVGPASSTGDDLASFNGTSGQIAKDSGIAAANVVQGPASVVSGDIATFNGTGGKTLQDSNVALTFTSLDTHPGYVAGSGAAGYTYIPLPRRPIATGAVGANQTVYCTYGFVAQSVTVDKLGVYIPTTAGSTNFNLAIYGTTAGRPGTLLASTGNFANNATGYLTGTISGNYSLKQGTPYWFCQMTGDATAVINGYNTTTGDGADMGALSTAESQLFSNSANMAGLQCAAACNGGTPASLTFPANLAGTTWTVLATTRSPAIGFHALSVP